MDFGALAPEINSAKLYLGPGTGTMLVAAGAWDVLADALHSAAASVGSVISGLADDCWRGTGSASMEDATAPYLTWLISTAAQAEHTATQARAAAIAYETALATTVSPQVIAANRNHLTSLLRTNFLDQNAPDIAVAESDYGQMWAQNADAMYRYARSSALAAQLEAFVAPPVGLPAAARQGCGDGGSSSMPMSAMVGADPRVLSAVAGVLDQLASPAGSSAASPDPATMGFATDQTDSSEPGSACAVLSSLVSRVMTALAGSAALEGSQTKGRPVSVRAWFAGSRAGGRHRLSRRGDRGEVTTTNAGAAAIVGKLSVPQTWRSTAMPGCAETGCGATKFILPSEVPAVTGRWS